MFFSFGKRVVLRMQELEIFVARLQCPNRFGDKRGDIMNKSASSKIVSGCVVIIGNEILSGRTQDVNLAFLAKELNELGIRLLEARVIPDVEQVIVDTVTECRKKFNYVFTTGGIGPTHDDITADCVAKAFGVDLFIHPDAEKIILNREAPADAIRARMRMARVPIGGELIENPTGGPPGFRIDNVFVLAGVPVVMQAMVSTLAAGHIQGGDPVRSRSVSARLTEGEIASALGEIQHRYPQIELGSYPYYKKDSYGVSLVMSGTSEAELDVMKEEVCDLIASFGVEAIFEG
ncbi:MAG: molybdenum cofactor synthesis domain-containing protein [Oceanicoccus sp.]|jgi:molybdenum cofactor synthesis domain-containing protein